MPEPGDVVVHKRSTKEGDVFRAVLDVQLAPAFPRSSSGPDPNSSSSSPHPTPASISGSLASLDAWRAVLATPELRKEYDPAVQDGRIVEMFDPETRIAKTDFALGWPAK